MTGTIWKYATDIYTIERPEVTISMPRGAEVLSVGPQKDTVCIWARVDPTAPAELRYFAFIGTGHDAPNGRYVGFASFDGPLVIHVFELSR